MKKSLLLFIMIIIIVLLLIIYPFIEIDNGSKLILFRYNDNIEEFDKVTCYDDGVSYNEERNISVLDINYDNFWCFYIITVKYEEGNKCDFEYYLEDGYIINFLNNAEIKYNNNNIDIASLIDGKTPIIGNKRYSGNDYTNEIGYVLNGRYEVMYAFYVDDLL